MSDVFDTAAEWLAQGRAVGLGRVVAVEGSAPRRAGAAMAVSDRREVAGSVSGGCVEGALVEAAEEVIASGRVSTTHFDADDDGWSVGLTCGGQLDVVVEPMHAWPAGVIDALRADLAAGRAVGLATVSSAGAAPGALVVRPDGSTVGTLGDATADRRLTDQVGMLLADGAERALTLTPTSVVARRRAGSCTVEEAWPTGAADAEAPTNATAMTSRAAPATTPATEAEAGGDTTGGDGDREPAEAAPSVVTGSAAGPDVFVQTWAPPARLLVFGAVDFTASLVRGAKLLGFHVTVCDARPVFATPERFPDADVVVVGRPERLLADVGPSLGPRDAVCVLTHDVKFDVPAIVGALATDVGYLGAMGSRRTHIDRVERLREAGVGDEGLGRLHSPIGLDLGGRTPGETAVSILAEIVAARSGAPVPASSLRDGHRPIHR
ncbi:MAG: hypothetical protein JWM47_610 [Acidimicrobiales bacterium]|nr:hypothetical protein [Acidimicrobiales bacterium]